MSKIRYVIGESAEPEATPRKVTLHCPLAAPGAVEVRVNGVSIAGFYVGDDHLELLDPRTDITGLAKGPDGCLKVK